MSVYETAVGLLCITVMFFVVIVCCGKSTFLAFPTCWMVAGDTTSCQFSVNMIIHRSFPTNLDSGPSWNNSLLGASVPSPSFFTVRGGSCCEGNQGYGNIRYLSTIPPANSCSACSGSCHPKLSVNNECNYTNKVGTCGIYIAVQSS